MNWESGIPLALAIGGFITGVMSLRSSLRTARASARKDDVDALRGIIAELRIELDEEKAERMRFAEDNRELWRGALTLLGQMEQSGIEPEWKPTKRILNRYGYDGGL